MKKIIHITAASLAVILILVFSACTDKDGWVDDNTYRITGIGYPGKNANEASFRLQACEAARIDATSKLLMKFAEAGIKSVKGKVSEEVIRNAVHREFSGIVKGMKVADTIYNDGKKMCQVIVELYEEDMRNKIEKMARGHVK